MRPFGRALQYSLENTRVDDNENQDYATWVEEDYCSPPLAMEREGVLDRYFNDIEGSCVESEEEGWDMIKTNRGFGIRNKTDIHMSSLPSSSSRITTYP
jgi:hypothetical protein